MVGVNYYTDSVEAPANSLGSMKSNPTSPTQTRSTTSHSYDGDLTDVLTRGEEFDMWVDDVHSHRFPPSSSGALGGPSVEDIGKVGIAVGERSGRTTSQASKSHTDRLIARMDSERFSSYESVS